MDNLNYDEIVVGEIDLTTPREILFGESVSETKLGKAGICTITVKGNEGVIPHFHIENKATKFDCCMCIFEPKYFSHPGHRSMMDSDQLCILNEHMNKQYDADATIWEYCKSLWIAQNVQGYKGKENAFTGYCKRNNIYVMDYNNPPSGKIEDCTGQPDYRTTRESIHN